MATRKRLYGPSGQPLPEPTLGFKPELVVREGESGDISSLAHVQAKRRWSWDYMDDPWMKR